MNKIEKKNYTRIKLQSLLGGECYFHIGLNNSKIYRLNVG